MGVRKLEYHGVVDENGTFKVYGYENMVSELATHMKNQKVNIIIERQVKKRTSLQNKYYWSCVIPIVKDGFYEMGEVYDTERVHETLKAMFLYDELVNEDTGEVVRVVKEFKDITTVEFQEYKRRIQHWASEWLHVNIPDPNEPLEIDYNKSSGYGNRSGNEH